MTFRSFSRFVRWYRWPLRLWCAGMVPISWGAKNKSELVGCAVLLALSCALVAPGLVGRRAPETLARFRRYRDSRQRSEAGRLRSLPLRGWTK